MQRGLGAVILGRTHVAPLVSLSVCLSACQSPGLLLHLPRQFGAHTQLQKKERTKYVTITFSLSNIRCPCMNLFIRQHVLLFPPQYIVNWAKFSRSREPENARTLTRHGIWVYELVNVLIRCVTNL